jgi:hypothetical protein
MPPIGRYSVVNLQVDYSGAFGRCQGVARTVPGTAAVLVPAVGSHPQRAVATLRLRASRPRMMVSITVNARREVAMAVERVKRLILLQERIVLSLFALCPVVLWGEENR